MAAVLVYAIPLAAMLAGTLAAIATSSVVSGITLGFGAVLMGLSVDYGLHVFYGLRKSAAPGNALARVARPILFCWLTTSGVFTLLLFSTLPAQRQLAVFTIAGLSAALILALVALPVFLPAGKQHPGIVQPRGLAMPSGRRRRLALATFLGLVLTAAVCWPAIRFDGRLQALSLVPDDLARAEQTVAASWGGVRSLAMLFSRDHDLDGALTKADALREYLTQTMPDERFISLSPLLPPRSAQQASIKRWKKFWADHGPELKRTIARESSTLGLTADAFAPFFDLVSATPQPVDREKLHALGLGELIDMLIVQDDASVSVITLVPDRPAIHALFDPSRQKLSQAAKESRLVSQDRLGQEIAEVLHRDMSRFLLAAGFLVVVLVTLLFKNLRLSLQALVPALAGLCALVLAVTLLHIPFNLYSIAATFLVLGLGVDYGIFMAARSAGQEDLGTETAVLVSGLTTLVGFGALVLASHPALHSIGLTVLVGIAAAIPAALFVVPALATDEHHA